MQPLNISQNNDSDGSISYTDHYRKKKKTLFFLYTKGDLDNPDFGGRASLLLPPHRTVGHLKAREGGGKEKKKKGELKLHHIEALYRAIDRE